MTEASAASYPFMLPHEILAGAMAAALTFYVLMGGADFGGGVWHLLARGPRARRQRELIAHAIGPVWEANHVWLILVVVILFSAFPPAFAAIGTALHIPITLLLIAIVLRGSAFAFQSHAAGPDVAHSAWELVFALASVLSPVLLGVNAGAIMSGRIRIEGGEPAGGFVRPWLRAYPFATGLFALALFSFLAAVYLTLETDDEELREDFRRRALVAAPVVAALALLVFLLAASGAPLIREKLARSRFTWPVQACTAALATAAIGALYLRRYRLARVCAAGQVAFIVWGWALAQYPYVVAPDLTFARAAGPEKTLHLVMAALALGALLLFPSFAYLYRVFKSRPSE